MVLTVASTIQIQMVAGCLHNGVFSVEVVSVWM